MLAAATKGQEASVVTDYTLKEMKDQGVTEDRLLLLKGVSGAFRPGVLTALMGMFVDESIPVWWRWYYWGNPLAWTIYGPALLLRLWVGDLH
ncbi:Pleiotropic drug resistance protein 1 [Helianthus annuus]|nr:Pleiotropic drug resistance protein 1 [Helianthus annuus]